jgi:hypothetical protein
MALRRARGSDTKRKLLVFRLQNHDTEKAFVGIHGPEAFSFSGKILYVMNRSGEDIRSSNFSFKKVFVNYSDVPQ